MLRLKNIIVGVHHMDWVHVNEALPKEGAENLVVWCGWPVSAVYLPSKNEKRPWYSEPAAINPIFHVTHWAIILPPNAAVHRRGQDSNE